MIDDRIVAMEDITTKEKCVLKEKQSKHTFVKLDYINNFSQNNI